MVTAKGANAHDKIFKRFLTNKRLARRFLEQYLPTHILKYCELNTLKTEPTNFLSVASRDCHGDLLYSLAFKDQQVYIYVLLEQQSQPHEMMPLRLIRYVIEITYHHIENNPKDKYPLVIPLVFYTGTKNWRYPLKLTDYYHDPKLAAESLLGAINLIKLQQISDEELLKHKDLSVLEIAQKHIFAKDAQKLGRLITQAFESSSKISNSLATDVLKYSLEAGRLEDPDEFLNFISEQLPGYKEVAMNAGEKLIARGEQRGMNAKAAEIARNMIANGIDLKSIVKCTGFSQSELKELAKQGITQHSVTKLRKSSKH